jgi:predicted dehydrogenase
MWHNGPIDTVCAMTETFVKERMHVETGKKEKVGIDDACTFMCRFDNGSLGNFESTRYARGHKALYTFEINGEKASIAWDLHDLHRLSYFDHADESIVRGWRSVHVTDGDMPYMDKWWVPGLQIGRLCRRQAGLADIQRSSGDAISLRCRAEIRRKQDLGEGSETVKKGIVNVRKFNCQQSS